MEITIEGLLSAIKFTLKNIGMTNRKLKNIRVKSLDVNNEDTLCCSFYPYSHTTLEIKKEICGIMGCFNGYFRSGDYKNLEFSNYAVVAYDESDVEILYAVSSKDTAEIIGKGSSIEWLKLTFFQENTVDYRLGQAKLIISEIEISLRVVIISILEKSFGAEWWDIALANKLGSSVKERYNSQFGEFITNGSILINYAFTLELKKIILTHWKKFNHLFSSIVGFEKSMDELNIIRREEAHNRLISQTHLEKLSKLYDELLANILIEFKTIESSYLVENWRLKIKKIFMTPYRTQSTKVKMNDELALLHELDTVVNGISHFVNYLSDILIRLKSISPPIEKKGLHDELVLNYQIFKNLHMELIDASKVWDFESSKSLQSQIDKQRFSMNEFVERFLLSEG